MYQKKKSQEENIDTEIIDQIGEASTSADFSEDHTIDSISDKNNDKEESEKLIRSTKDFDQNVNESEFPTQKIDFAIKRKIRGKSGSSKKQFHCERCEKSWWEWHHSFLLSRPHEHDHIWPFFTIQRQGLGQTINLIFILKVLRCSNNLMQKMTSITPSIYKTIHQKVIFKNFDQKF